METTVMESSTAMDMKKASGVRAGAAARLWNAPAEECYGCWPDPECIVSDGAYGIGGFPGDPSSAESLAEWYRPHIEEWSRRATPSTTLWFWNTEVGWACVHPEILRHGWRYARCCIWDKGSSHVAGNVNTGTLRQFPCVTEVCVQYVRDELSSGVRVRDWLRSEWLRSGLPLRLANDACGVRNAATRKYLSVDGAHYPPPEDMLERLRRYADDHGDPAGRPYFDVAGPMRPKFHLPFGFTNVWRCPQVSARERARMPGGSSHPNQKPLSLMGMIVESCTDPDDVVWEPFGGVFSGALAADRLGRRSYSAEPDCKYFSAGRARFLADSETDLF